MQGTWEASRHAKPQLVAAPAIDCHCMKAVSSYTVPISVKGKGALTIDTRVRPAYYERHTQGASSSPTGLGG